MSLARFDMSALQNGLVNEASSLRHGLVKARTQSQVGRDGRGEAATRAMHISAMDARGSVRQSVLSPLLQHIHHGITRQMPALEQNSLRTQVNQGLSRRLQR